MGTVGDALANAMTESFFATLGRANNGPLGRSGKSWQDWMKASEP